MYPTWFESKFWKKYKGQRVYDIFILNLYRDDNILLMLITLLHDIKAFFEVKYPDVNTNTYRVKRKRLMFVCFWSIMSLFISWKIKYLLVLHQRVKKKDFWQEKFLRWFVFQNSGRGPQYVPYTWKRAYQLFVCI